MKRFAIRMAAVAALFVAMPAIAKDYTVGKLQISQVWTRVTPPASRVAGGFMTITNAGTEPDTLIGGSALVSQKIEVHEMSMDAGIMKMRELKPGLVIRPGATVTLKPGSFHIMFIDLKEPIKQGAPLKGSLVFEKAGKIDIEYTVEPFGTRAPGDGGHAMPGAGKGSHH